MSSMSFCRYPKCDAGHVNEPAACVVGNLQRALPVGGESDLVQRGGDLGVQRGKVALAPRFRVAPVPDRRRVLLGPRPVHERGWEGDQLKTRFSAAVPSGIENTTSSSRRAYSP